MSTCACGRWLALVFLLATQGAAEAARISDLVEHSMGERALRFFSFQDPSLRFAVVGSMLLGIACGLMGAFLVVRKLSLMGDALSHAVLPGVVLGFLWNMSKDPVAIFIGATVAGLLGAGTVQLVRSTTRHKEDAALGLVLASFFAAGICLFTMLQNLPGGNKSGLDKFMFGQAAALGRGDVWLLGIVAVLVVVFVVVFYKELVITSFDAGFSRSIGLPVRACHFALMLLLAFAIVASLQAVGVVLVSAMLVIPAAAAYLLTDRMGLMLGLSAGFGMASGVVGSFFSYVGRNFPTGPFMVVAAAVLFAGALGFGPRHGMIARWWRHRSRSIRIERENMLKAIYHVMENGGFRDEVAGVTGLAVLRREPIEEVRRKLEGIVRSGAVTVSPDGSGVAFTPNGWRRACEIVRNHRLWELYLNHSANIAADHVHDSAEDIEHLLGEENVRELERHLGHARRDPHGRLIPGIEDISRGSSDRSFRKDG